MADERLRALPGSVLLVPTPDDPPAPGGWTLVERDVLSVLMDSDDAGLRMPAFTTPAALGRWRPEGGAYVERDAAWFFGVAAADPEGRVVINPGSPDEMVVPPGAVAALAAGGDPSSEVGGGGAMLVATPTDGLPPDVAAAVADALAAEPLVASARLFLIDSTGTGPDPVVLVDMPGAAPDRIDEAMGSIVGRIAARTDEAAGLRFWVVDDGWRTTYGSGGLPLYPP